MTSVAIAAQGHRGGVSWQASIAGVSLRDGVPVAPAARIPARNLLWEIWGGPLKQRGGFCYYRRFR